MKGISILATRFFALFCLLRAIEYIGILAVIFGRQTPILQGRELFLYGWSFLVWFIPALFLWFAAEPFAKRLVSDARAFDPLPNLNSEAEVLGLACTIAGILTLTDAIPDLARIVMHLLGDFPSAIREQAGKEQKLWLVAFTAKVVVALYLLLGWRTIVGLFRKFREAGRKPNLD